MKGKNTLLAAIFQKMSPDMQKQVANELNEFAKDESNIDTGFTVASLLKYTGTSESMTPEDVEDKRSEELSNKMFEYLKKPGMDTPEGRKASGLNIQEI
jgi:hypothetical protein